MKEGKQEMLNEQKMDSFSISCFYGYGSFKSSALCVKHWCMKQRILNRISFHHTVVVCCSCFKVLTHSLPVISVVWQMLACAWACMWIKGYPAWLLNDWLKKMNMPQLSQTHVISLVFIIIKLIKLIRFLWISQICGVKSIMLWV